MKTKIMKIARLAQIVVLASLTLTLVNCANGNNSSTPTSQYVYSNGLCLDSRNNNMQVPSNYCATNTRYQWQNGQCYDATTRTYTTNTMLCQYSGTNSCNGTYYYYPQSVQGMQSVPTFIQCSSSSPNYYGSGYQSGAYGMVYNCRGLALYPTNNGYQNGYPQGYQNGYPPGYQNGYPAGFQNGLGYPQQNQLIQCM